ncbi:universal stress protein [Paracoccus sp. TK19116]|uniref:Universal stress protein n=1 Tax=Paracoccus albicereus TaxID=2922394 RepID=A0ABT1MTI0_9RHOB|nr:universal stress protein [Paracoccus albicereus]MCQ0971624.1 universal stress protein [Paracoccus albicereus]
MIRKILVPVRGDGKGDNALAHAAAIAHRHNAHIQVVHCRPRPQDLMPYGVAIPEFLRKQIVDHSYQVADQEEQGMRGELEVLARNLDLDLNGHGSGDRASVSFAEEAGRQVDVIKRLGRLADLIVVPKPDRDRNLGHNTLKTALFHASRPVMMAPMANPAPKVLGAKVTLAWNGSAEAARALSQCKSILRGAEKIWVLTNGSDSGPGTTAADLQAYLKLHELTAEIHEWSASQRIGRALLDATRELGADLMIMGAYGESHERETVFGGNTQTIVDTAEIPVMLNH